MFKSNLLDFSIEELGESLRSIRQEQGLEIKQVAKKAKVEAYQISHFERGNLKSIPKWVGQYANAIGIELVVSITIKEKTRLTP